MARITETGTGVSVQCSDWFTRVGCFLGTKANCTMEAAPVYRTGSGQLTPPWPLFSPDPDGADANDTSARGLEVLLFPRLWSDLEGVSDPTDPGNYVWGVDWMVFLALGKGSPNGIATDIWPNEQDDVIGSIGVNTATIEAYTSPAGVLAGGSSYRVVVPEPGVKTYESLQGIDWLGIVGLTRNGITDFSCAAVMHWRGVKSINF